MEFYGFFWRNIKYLSLVVLVAQNTALVLTMRYSRIVHGQNVYLASTAVFLTELLKFVICIMVVGYNSGYDVIKTLNTLYVEIVRKLTETAKLSIPSLLYTVQNNLLYVALSHLDAATFQVTYQLKILTTALFSVAVLHKKLTRLKWMSLIVLMSAVILVQWPSESSGTYSQQGMKSPLIGLSAVVLACVSSGFTGVYIEKLLKESDTSMWIRNIQLSLLSLFTGLFGVIVTDWNAIMAKGFFQGYNYLVVVVILLQALGGILIAVVMKYADNILKGFATSVSIVLSSFISFFILQDFKASWTFILGTVLVLCATILYSRSNRPPPSSVLPTTTSGSSEQLHNT